MPAPVAASDDDLDAVDAFALDARMRATLGYCSDRAVPTLAAMHRVHWQTGRLLPLVFDLRLYRWLGFRTAAQYVKERLGIGIRTAEMLVAVERVTWHAPQLANAYERGAISPLRALIIAPVLSGAHEGAWLARAHEVTVRRLSDEVTRALSHQDVQPLCEPVAPPSAGRLAMPSDAQMRARFADETPDVVISVPAPVSVAALFATAIAAFTEVGEPRWRGSSGCSSMCGPNATDAHATLIRSSRVTGGGARCRRAVHGATYTTITSCSARGVAKMRATIASRSARRITSTGCMAAGTSAPRDMRPTAFIGSSASVPMRRRS